MLCENCNTNEANTHIKRIVNGEATQIHLCPACARELGYDDPYDSFNLKMSSLFSAFFNDTPFALNTERAVRCESCGSTFNDIVKTGMVGCVGCYETFYDKLLPSIHRMHGRAVHNGKIPNNPVNIVIEPTHSNQGLIEQKRLELKAAIEEQNFEQAALLRDEINEMQGEV